MYNVPDHQIKKSIKTSSNEPITWTMLAMSIGNMDNGNRRILKRDNDTKAFSAFKTFSGEDRTYTANVVRDT